MLTAGFSLAQLTYHVIDLETLPQGAEAAPRSRNPANRRAISAQRLGDD